jgi:hypothetical protein
MPSAASLRTAFYLVIGSLLVWRYAASRLAAGSTSFASLSLHGSFHTASQTGIAGAVRSAAAGFIAGLLHTLAGADHLAALTPLTIGRSSARASLLGALWGFGHSTGQLILGILLVVLKDRFEAFVPALTRWGGTTVGLSLIGIGGLGLLELWQDHRAEQTAASADVALAGSGGSGSVSVGSSGSSIDKDAEESRGLSMGLFANGILFGLQPDALFVIIPALTLPRWAAVSYISMFVIGTVAAMGGYTAVIGATSKAIQERNPWLTTNLSVLASCTAIVIGAIVLFSL